MLTRDNIPLGYMGKDVEQRVKMGDVIPFTSLKNYIGKKVLYVGQTLDPKQFYYEIVEISDYYKDCNTFYDCYWKGGRYVSKPAFTCDRVAFRNKDRARKNDLCAISEGYCSNGRFEPAGLCPSCFYEFSVS